MKDGFRKRKSALDTQPAGRDDLRALKDFPDAALALRGVVAVEPDGFTRRASTAAAPRGNVSTRLTPPFDTPSHAMRAGDLIGDRFVLEKIAERGGMAVVWRARDQRSGALTAVKLLRDRMGDSELDRLSREAQVLAGLDHPGVVRYVAHGATAAGTAFLAMEWLEGETLGRRLSRGPIGVADTRRVLGAVADALASVHRRGIVHRDLAPQNLLAVGGDLSHLKVIDFGIARWDEQLYAVTRKGIIVGTLAYMAPEQALGERDLDARVDIFALGCVAYECIVGRPPFAATLADSMPGCLAVETAPRVREAAPDVPVELDELIAEMLARDPAKRIADGSALASRLAALDAATPLAPTETPPSR